MTKYMCRAKRIDNGEWAYGYYAESNYYLDDSRTPMIIPFDAVLYPHCEISEWHHVDPNTACRYTGMTEFVMKDQTVHRPLFEGDIVEVWSPRLLCCSTVLTPLRTLPPISPHRRREAYVLR